MSLTFYVRLLVFTENRVAKRDDLNKQSQSCKQLQKRPLKDGGFTFAPLKNDKVRVLKPAPFVMDLLKRRQKEQGAQRLKAGQLRQGWSTTEERKTALVFTTATGGNLSPQTVYNHYKKLAVQIGAPDSRVHDLRHTYATLFSCFLPPFSYNRPTFSNYLYYFH